MNLHEKHDVSMIQLSPVKTLAAAEKKLSLRVQAVEDAGEDHLR